jgi:hypothetical protein
MRLKTFLIGVIKANSFYMMLMFLYDFIRP